jgi:hypothetical protein
VPAGHDPLNGKYLPRAPSAGDSGGSARASNHKKKGGQPALNGKADSKKKRDTDKNNHSGKTENEIVDEMDAPEKQPKTLYQKNGRLSVGAFLPRCLNPRTGSFVVFLFFPHPLLALCRACMQKFICFEKRQGDTH